MVFVDEAVITVKSGDGGRGCVSFRRERFIPRGGPDGGNGGDGGSIVIRATERLYTLRDFTRRRRFKAGNGEPGRGKSQSGRNGRPCIIETPVGTIVQDHETGDILADLIEDNQEIELIPGGKGGKGNQHFATSTNRAPKMAQPGRPGEEKRLKLTLKLLADIGLVGLPNAGKSTLLSRLTMARPKIGAYPFTTTAPNLGIVGFESGETLVMADIPGLVEGASEGRGLGDRFLRHIERTRLLVHVLDLTYLPVHHIAEDFLTLRREMEAFSPSLAEKPFLVAINKTDLYGPKQRDIQALEQALRERATEVVRISALTGDGLGALKGLILQRWRETRGE